MKTRAPLVRFVVVALVLTASDSFAPAPLCAKGAGETADNAASDIEFVMPWGGSYIPDGPLVVAGRLPAGAGRVDLLLDGVPVADVTRETRTFVATISPSSGKHELVVRAGELSAKLRFTYGAGRSAARYIYHRPVLEGRCAECHAGMRRGTANAESDTCKSCHRALGVIFPYVHGPVAAGRCLVCHDPHGSSWPSLMPETAKTMCTKCHDQPTTITHVETSRSRVCYLCHNPHASMNKKFLYDIVK